jgi:hypothetical protein
MRWLQLLTTVTILIVVGASAMIKSDALSISLAAPRQALLFPQRASAARPATMQIVPAPVIDPKAEFFLGTGDGSNGSWIRP